MVNAREWLDKGECLRKAKKWWFKPKPQEREGILMAKNQEELRKVWEEANNQRDFSGNFVCLALSLLVFFGWDKFYAWCQKQWGWDDDDN